MSKRYAAHQNFVQQAQGSTALGSVLIIVVVMEIAFYMAFLFVAALLPPKWQEIYETGDTPIGVIAQLLTFALIAWVLVRLVRRLHGRGFWSMVGPLSASVKHLKIAAIAVFWVLLLREVLPPWIAFDELAETRNLFGWAVWLLPATLALIIQTGVEELYFRGYLQQQLGAYSNNPWVWMVVPSVLFGLGHYLNGYGPSDGVLYAVWATMLGLACADLTARTGNIGAAIGLHLSNNLFAFVLVGEQEMPSSGLALFLFPPTDYSLYDYSLSTLTEAWVIPELLILALSVGIMWLAARIALRV